MITTILRLPQVQMRCGLARATIYLRIKQGLLTPPIGIGERAVGWPESEIAEINAARIASKSTDEIRELVRQLLKKRIAP